MNVYDDKMFIQLQKRIIKDIELTKDNVQEKILELPILYTKYRKLYFEQRRILKNISNEIKQTKKERYHYYKFSAGFRLDSATEIKLYVDGDDELCTLRLLYDKQDGIVSFLEQTVQDISRMSYLIRSYVDLEKLRNGVMV